MDGGKLSVVNARTESGRQNDLLGKFKMAASDLVSTFHKLSSDAIFVVCSQTFTLLWLIKTAVHVEISRYCFRVSILQ